MRRKARPKRPGLLWMVIIIAALIWLLRFMDGDWKLFDILDDVLFFEFASYVDPMEDRQNRASSVLDHEYLYLDALQCCY